MWCLIFCLGINAQGIVKIDSIAVSKTVPAEYNYIQFTENKDKTIDFNAILTRRIQQVVYKNEAVFLITQRYQTANGVDVDSSFVNLNGLKPIAYHTSIATENYQEIVEFGKHEISNSLISMDSIGSVIKTIEKNNHFYNGVIINELIGELPLEKGMKFSFDLVNPGKRYYESSVNVSVIGLETLELSPSFSIACWKLEVKFGNSPKGTTEWYAFDNHIQIRSQFEFDNGNKFIRTMIVN